VFTRILEWMQERDREKRKKLERKRNIHDKGLNENK